MSKVIWFVIGMFVGGLCIALQTFMALECYIAIGK